MSNSYKVQKLNQLIRGWINYFKIGSMKGLCKRSGSETYATDLRMCIWKHWKTPQNRAKNLMKLGRTPIDGIQNCLQWRHGMRALMHDSWVL